MSFSTARLGSSLERRDSRTAVIRASSEANAASERSVDQHRTTVRRLSNRDGDGDVGDRRAALQEHEHVLLAGGLGLRHGCLEILRARSFLVARLQDYVALLKTDLGSFAVGIDTEDGKPLVSGTFDLCRRRNGQSELREAGVAGIARRRLPDRLVLEFAELESDLLLFAVPLERKLDGLVRTDPGAPCAQDRGRPQRVPCRAG